MEANAFGEFLAAKKLSSLNFPWRVGKGRCGCYGRAGRRWSYVGDTTFCVLGSGKVIFPVLYGSRWKLGPTGTFADNILLEAKCLYVLLFIG